jgi:hypothetical protein
MDWALVNPRTTSRLVFAGDGWATIQIIHQWIACTVDGEEIRVAVLIRPLASLFTPSEKPS